MDTGNRMLLADKLKLLCIGTVLALLSFVPAVGGLVSLVGGVISIIAIAKLSPLDEGYKKALGAVIAGIICAVLVVFAAGVGAVSAVGGSGAGLGIAAILILALSIATMVFSLMEAYFVCNTTSQQLLIVDCSDEAALGEMTWKARLAAFVVAVIATLLGSFLSISLLSTVSTIVTALANALFAWFLYKAYTALQA